MSIIKKTEMNKRTLYFWLAGIFLVSLSMLAFEIALTRILSVMFYYHYIFIVVSMALLGLGLGGVFVHLFRRQMPVSGPASLDLLAGLFSLSIPLSVIASTRLVYIGGLGSFILVYALILFIPFFFAGALLAQVFRLSPALSSKLYGADLLGAATGAVAAVLSLNLLGGVNTVFLTGLVASLGALLLALSERGQSIRKAVIVLFITTAILGTSLGGLWTTDAPVAIDPDKEIYRILRGLPQPGEIIETRWSAFGRTDLVRHPDLNDNMVIYTDGTSGSPMYQFNGDLERLNPTVASLKTDFPGYVPLMYLAEKEKNEALVIGPGGGRDILLALLAGVDRVTAVEVNPDIVDLVKEYSWYNGGLFTDLKNVSVVVDEGRNFLKRQNDKYDIIMLSLPVTNTTRSIEAYALTENFLFTAQSIIDYFEHLTDEGRLIVVNHAPVEALKLLSVTLSALKQLGLREVEVMQRIYIVGSDMYPVLVVKKTPFASTETRSVHQSIHELGFDPTTSYLPLIRQGECPHHEGETRYDECGMLNPALIAISKGLVSFDYLEEAFLRNGADFRPVTDNRPFFYKFEQGVPPPVLLVFWSSLMVLVITIPIAYRKRRHHHAAGNKNPLRFLALFSLLGVGFMLVEIASVQRFMLFLGQPVLSLAVMLFSLLVGAGLGSIFSSRFSSARTSRSIAIAALFIFVMLVIHALVLPVVFEQLLGLGLAARLFFAFLMLLPLGFLMGLPFPLGIRLLGEMGMKDYVPWLWGVNGICSVLGSALTIILALTFGFTQALLAGAICYLAVFLMFSLPRPRQKERLEEVVGSSVADGAETGIS